MVQTRKAMTRERTTLPRKKSLSARALQVLVDLGHSHLPRRRPQGPPNRSPVIWTPGVCDQGPPSPPQRGSHCPGYPLGLNETNDSTYTLNWSSSGHCSPDGHTTAVTSEL